MANKIIKQIYVGSETYDIEPANTEELVSQTAYTSKGTSTKVPQITTNALGQVTNISEVDIAMPSVPTVNNAYVSLQVAGSEKTKFYANDSTNRTFNVTASDLGLSQALIFVGISTTDPATGTATVSGHTSWKKGEVVLYKRSGETYYEEYVNITGHNGTAGDWELLGDDSSYARKGVSTSSAGSHTHSISASSTELVYALGTPASTVSVPGAISTATLTASSAGAHTHGISYSTAPLTYISGVTQAVSSGAHTHSITPSTTNIPSMSYNSTTGVLTITSNSLTVVTGVSVTGSAGAHTHSVSSTSATVNYVSAITQANSSGAHTHNVPGSHTHSTAVSAISSLNTASLTVVTGATVTGSAGAHSHSQQ